jgi:glycine cleavage system transcriptional repressor
MKTLFEHAYVMVVMSDDHPGIISAVSTAVSRAGGNIDAASQTVLGGYFTLIMVVSLPRATEPDALAADVSGSDASGLQVLVRPFIHEAADEGPRPVERFVITAFGKDRPGLISHFSQYLAGKDINITDLSWNRTGDDFVMIAEVDIPTRIDFGLLAADLEDLARDEAFTLKLQHENIFVATNQLRLTR